MNPFLPHEPEATLMAEPATAAADAGVRTPKKLAGIVEQLASRPHEWMERVRLRAHRRWYQRLHDGPDYDVWLISWLPRQSTGFHDHGASSGAFIVALGNLQEQRPGESVRDLPVGSSCTFGPGYTHNVRNVSAAPSISIHAYSPPLTEMNEYELDGSGLVPRDILLQQVEAVDEDWPAKPAPPAGPARPAPQRIEQVLAAARARLKRLSPGDVHDAVANAGAVLVDIRPADQRRVEGSIAGALVVERNVLEWRFDPASSSRLPLAIGYDLPVIVFCSEGYTSSLAAASLQDLGLWRATDMTGGFQAWRDAGLPMLPPATQ